VRYWQQAGQQASDLQEAKALLEELEGEHGEHNIPLQHLAQFCSVMLVESMTGGQ
jgi:hypothetical protein